MPEDYQSKTLNRPWLWNLCNNFIFILSLGNTFDSQKFSDFISDAIKAREDYIIKTKSLEIKTHPRIVDAIAKSSFVSSMLCKLLNCLASKGRSHLLIRTPKQRNIKTRNVALYREDESKSDEEEEKDARSLKDEVISLTKKLNEKEKEIEKHEKYADLLSDLFQKGIIDGEGNFIQDNIEF